MKKKVLLSSIVTIVLCLCLIAGSTFALFTDKTEFNIAVTSGDVEIKASANVSAIYSAVGVNEAYNGPKELLRDENGAFYTHEEQEKTFLNGGTATVKDGTVVINRITPGDKVDIDININNKSNVAISYRYKLVSNNTNLATGMKVTTFKKDGPAVATEGLAVWTSEWYSADATAGKAEKIETRTISIELPIYAGNEYQSEYEGNQYYDENGVAHSYDADAIQSVTYTIIVEAVQGNANVVDGEEFQVYEDEAVEGVPPVLSDDYDPETNSVYINELFLQGGANIIVDQNYPITLENVTADVNGSVIIIDEYAPAILIMNCDFILDEGEYIIDASAYEGGIGQVFLVNVTVNGKLLDLGTVTAEADQYLNNVYWHMVADPNLVS